MILPNKYIPLPETHLAIGARLLVALRGRPRTVADLWRKLKNQPSVSTFDRMAIALDLLFALGLVKFVNGKIERTH